MPKLTVWTDEKGVHLHADGVTPIEMLGLAEYARIQAAETVRRDALSITKLDEVEEPDNEGA